MAHAEPSLYAPGAGLPPTRPVPCQIIRHCLAQVQLLLSVNHGTDARSSLGVPSLVQRSPRRLGQGGQPPAVAVAQVRRERRRVINFRYSRPYHAPYTCYMQSLQESWRTKRLLWMHPLGVCYLACLHHSDPTHGGLWGNAGLLLVPMQRIPRMMISPRGL
jgi:hypothetical protein